MFRCFLVASLPFFIALNAAYYDEEADYNYYGFDVDYEQDDPGPVLCEYGKFGGNLINKTLRTINKMKQETLMGNTLNGPGRGNLPKGKCMRELKWSCTLEWIAMQILGDGCKYKSSEHPHLFAHLFFEFNTTIESVLPNFNAAVNKWITEIYQYSVPENYIWNHTDGYVLFPTVVPELHDYLNLMKDSTSKIGCAELKCKEPGPPTYVNAHKQVNTTMHRYQALCLTNRPSLTGGRVVYRVGNGNCTMDSCPGHIVCNATTGLYMDAEGKYYEE